MSVPKVFLFFYTERVPRFYTEGVPLLLHLSSSLTPKVFANFSPGLGFGNPGIRRVTLCWAQPCQGCAAAERVVFPRVAKAQPWAGIREHLRCKNR
jgi:hypothetical protein